MCVQCMVGAMGAAAGASGARAWLVARFGARMSPRVKKRLTVGLCGAGVLAAGLIGPSAA